MGRRAAMAGLAALAGVLAVTMLTGCTRSANDAGGAAAQPQGESAAAAPTGAGGAAAGADSSGAGAGADAGSVYVPLADDRKIIRTATVSLEVTVPAPRHDRGTGDTGDPGGQRDIRRALADAAAQAATKVRALAPGSGGYVSASESGADRGGATVSIVLRIPAESYDSVMHSLDGIGRVTARTEKTDDVTDEMVDVASRIATMKASIDRIRTLLAQADKIGDVISIESELAQREADLESLQNRQTALRGQVALSTISVTVTAVTEATIQRAGPDRRSGFLAGLDGGWRALTAFGTWLGSVAGALLPFTPAIALVVAGLVWAARRRRRAEAATAGTATQVLAPRVPGPPSPPAGAGDLP